MTKPEPLKGKIVKGWVIRGHNFFFGRDVKSAVKLLDEQLDSLCVNPPLTYDEFMKVKKRIIKYCFEDVVN